ncbi:hypothetical protein ACFPM0_27925 [Pseudonocardia sulfidoxydans]|uniref:hypothetical protein n=1 Tax=Pseudonocardia sulfidoxydans TaxID=54011 RepID=UPI00360E208B
MRIAVDDLHPGQRIVTRLSLRVLCCLQRHGGPPFRSTSQSITLLVSGGVDTRLPPVYDWVIGCQAKPSRSLPLVHGTAVASSREAARTAQE